SDENGSRPYDRDCGTRYYNGSLTSHTDSTADRCCTLIKKNGYLTRTTINILGDGGCDVLNDSHGDGEEVVACACTTSNLCNTGSFCEQCDFPFSTLHTTIATTTTTSPTTTIISKTSEATSTSPTTTIRTTTSDVATTTTTEPLSCYSCYDCPEVDTNTQVVQDSAIASCVTTILLNLDNRMVIRGESHDSMTDGDCRQHGDAISCDCNTSYCNGQLAVQLLDLQQTN
ncbi:unnamed protein product, partial [Meganyctiphanes norvegica]